MSEKEIDHDGTDDPVCPYCGYVMIDAWEWFSKNQEEAEMECGNGACEKLFTACREFSVSYTMFKKEST